MKRTTGYRRRADVNHGVIRLAFSHLGCSVQDLRLVGSGCPDLLIGYRGQNRLVEVKNAKGRNRIEQAQKDFAATWQGSAPVVVRTIDDVTALVQSWPLPPQEGSRR